MFHILVDIVTIFACVFSEYCLHMINVVLITFNI